MPTSNERKMLSSNEALKELTHCVFVRDPPLAKISCKSMNYFLRNPMDTQTNQSDQKPKPPDGGLNIHDVHIGHGLGL